MKLHLGCGQIYLPGYVNIDLPGTSGKVDVCADISSLHYRKHSIDEIRLHHLFEHFDRPSALVLLCRWHDWLKPGGLLRIETPDLIANSRLLISPLVSKNSRDQLVRHLYGSHEAGWAIHRDGWYEEKFRFVLSEFGFKALTFKYNRWGILRNIEVFAYRAKNDLTFDKCLTAAEKVLTTSTVRVNTKDPKSPEGSEHNLLKSWLRAFVKGYQRR